MSQLDYYEGSGSVVERLTRDPGVVGLSVTGGIVFVLEQDT